MSPLCPHKRMQSATRMDCLENLLIKTEVGEETTSVNRSSPRDSLSPLDDRFGDDGNRKGVDVSRTSSASSARNAQTQQKARITFLDTEHKHATATPCLSTTTKEACSPRSPLITRPNRPTDLKLAWSNGLTTISNSDLKQRICDGHTNACATTTEVQVPRHVKPKKRLPKTPAIAMGNQSSTIDNSQVAADHESLSSVNRKPMRVLRKSSTNLFKRIDAKSPLPRPLTATSILVSSKRSPEEEESPIDPFMDPTHAAREPMILHSDSTMTVTQDDDVDRPLSAATTVLQSRKESRSPYQASVDDPDTDGDEAPPVPPHRGSALSPTIPAPSPLPEDSPHKYGLKDRMDTPELVREPPPPPEDNSLAKARRRSSGLDIFNEAKSLRSAQSFLNGLSTSRRRVESTNRTSETWPTTCTGSTSRPGSRPGSRQRAPSAIHMHAKAHGDMDGRKRGHNFKCNGFAFSRALNITQMKCFRNHSRLLRSKNKTAPVECAVCHMDDDEEHFTCSWCALRMCRYCRTAFGEGGITALRARIKEAETGPGASPASSAESLVKRGRSRAFV